MDAFVVLLAFVAGGALGVGATVLVTSTILGQERRSAAQALAQIEQGEQRLRDAFQALSAEALRENHQSFLALAKGTLGELHQGASHELETRQQAIESLVKPLQESLQQVDAKLHVVEKERREHYGQLTEQLRHVASAHEKLHSETHNLSKALRAPTVRGRWGEIQLKRVVEMAGMLEHCDFSVQETPQPMTAGCALISWCGSPGASAWWSTPKRRSKPISLGSRPRRRASAAAPSSITRGTCAIT
jgi:predicted DNA-binding protein YlxM (UPF0122 family)